jgi:hypothetical protein
MPEIVEQQITLKYKIKEFTTLREEIVDVLKYYSIDKRDQSKRYKELTAILELDI